MDDELNDNLETQCLSSGPIRMSDDQSSETITEHNSKPIIKSTLSNAKHINKMVSQNAQSISANRTKPLKRKSKVANNPLEEPKQKNDSVIADAVNVKGPNRTVWAKYRNYQTDVKWKQLACTRLGLRFLRSAGFQPDSPDTVVTRQKKLQLSIWKCRRQF